MQNKSPLRDRGDWWPLARLRCGLQGAALIAWGGFGLSEGLAQGVSAADVGRDAVVGQPVAQPLSAIDWLNDGTTPPGSALSGSISPLSGGLTLSPPLALTPPEPPVTATAVTPDVTVMSLDRATLDGVGLLPSSVSGLPLDLWQGSRSLDLVTLIDQPVRSGLPAMQALLYTLLLAEADAPRDAGTDARLLQARIDALLRMGAVEPAQAMLERAGPEHPALFSRWFDATLLTGAEDTACAALMRAPHLSPSLGAQVFCTARRGDWPGAMLTLDTARAIDAIPAVEAEMLARFMDPELFEDMPLPRAPVRPSPLVFRLYEAMGEPLPTAPLPRAFAVADLRDTAGWRAQIEAAERLASTGALAPNRLLGLYSERQPAASGGVWERVAAVQRLDEALRSGEAEAVAVALPRVWAAMQAADLGVALASLYSPGLMRVELSGVAGALAYRIALLGPDYESAALSLGPGYPEFAFVTALARGQVGTATASTPLEQAIQQGFAATGAPADMATLLAERRLGEVILRTIQQIQQAAQGELVGLADGLATLRAVGLEDSARRAALQLILMDQRG
jgi:hypothetical protein